jgi:CRISPR-associated protein Csx17
VVPGFGSRPLRQVLADVLAWRSRAAVGEAASAPAGTDAGRAGPAFRGVPSFQRGIPVPHQDLHAFAASPASSGGPLIDDGELDIWLRACLALDWSGARHSWGPVRQVLPIPALALLHPLAEGGAEHGDSAAAPLALGPDWAVRLAAGQVRDVHAEAVRRLRQAGWEAVPPLPDDGAASGTSLAAALVPRCRGALDLLKAGFAFQAEDEDDPAAPPGDLVPASH